MLVFCNTGKRKLSFTFRRSDVLAALPAIPLRDIPATGVRRPCSIPRFARQRHGTHVLLQGRQIAFERPCRHPRTSRRELSGEVRNCHLKPSNRSGQHRWRHLFLARSAAPRWRGFTPPNHPDVSVSGIGYRISDSHERGRSTSPMGICHLSFVTLFFGRS